jgi:hypothetical protein
LGRLAGPVATASILRTTSSPSPMTRPNTWEGQRSQSTAREGRIWVRVLRAAWASRDPCGTAIMLPQHAEVVGCADRGAERTWRRGHAAAGRGCAAPKPVQHQKRPGPWPFPPHHVLAVQPVALVAGDKELAAWVRSSEVGSASVARHLRPKKSGLRSTKAELQHAAHRVAALSPPPHSPSAGAAAAHRCCLARCWRC